jgi:hypothetical protein
MLPITITIMGTEFSAGHTGNVDPEYKWIAMTPPEKKGGDGLWK